MQILAASATCGRRIVVAALAVVLALGACTPDRGAPLADLAASVPAGVAARGLLLRTGADGHGVLLEVLGLDPAEVVATATTGAPALRVLRVSDPGGVVDVLGAQGWGAADLVDGWQVLVRPDEVDGFVGIPAVAVGPRVVAVGSVDELEALAEGADPVPMVTAVLDDAAVALVQPAGALDGGTASPVLAGDLPAFTSVVLTADAAGGSGVLALQLPEGGAQADAVGLAVRVRTAGPVDDAGRGVLEPGSPLTSGEVVRLDVGWGVEPGPLLVGGLGSGLLDFLGGG